MLGMQWEAMDLVTFGLGIITGTRLETTGGNGFGNFRPENHYWDTLGRQREAMDLVTFTGNQYWDTLGRQREAMDLITFRLGITTGTCVGGSGRQRIW